MVPNVEDAFCSGELCKEIWDKKYLVYKVLSD